MDDTAPLSLPDRFNCLIEGLFSDITTRLALVLFPLLPAELLLVKLIWRRLRRMNRRFAAIVAHFRAGTRPTPDSAPHRPPAPTASHAPRPREPSRRVGWVIHAISWFVMIRHYELEELLDDPEMETLVAGAPELGFVLRPICRMLAVKPPAWLRRPHRRTVKQHPPAPDWLVNEPGAELRPDGSVWLRLGASTTWRKPGFWKSLEEAQKFDPPVRIWPREE